VSKKNPTREEASWYARGILDKETERGVAIVGATMIDAGLDACLKIVMRPPDDTATIEALDKMFGGFGQLGSTHAKFHLAYLLGIIGPKTFNDTNTINQIRNRFAHFASDRNHDGQIQPLRFKSVNIAQWIRSLSQDRPAYVRYKRTDQPDPDPEAAELRDLLMNSIISIYVYLTDYVLVFDDPKGNRLQIP
jgi:hypothetical protein